MPMPCLARNNQAVGNLAQGYAVIFEKKEDGITRPLEDHLHTGRLLNHKKTILFITRPRPVVNRFYRKPSQAAQTQTAKTPTSAAQKSGSAMKILKP